jgi:hypothetical protein
MLPAWDTLFHCGKKASETAETKLELWCRETDCGFESHALRSSFPGNTGFFCVKPALDAEKFRLAKIPLNPVESGCILFDSVWLGPQAGPCKEKLA